MQSQRQRQSQSQGRSLMALLLLTIICSVSGANECHTTAPAVCNVCAACCNDFIPDGAPCDTCVSSKCPKKQNECHTTNATCNVCTACCNDFIPDGAACDKCVNTKCAAPAPTNECHSNATGAHIIISRESMTFQSFLLGLFTHIIAYLSLAPFTSNIFSSPIMYRRLQRLYHLLQHVHTRRRGM